MSKGRSLQPPTEESIVEILRERARGLPDRGIFWFLENGETERESFTYSQLDHRARTIASEIQSRIQPGDRVLLLYGAGLEFVAALFGCFYAGAVAVACCPPRLDFSPNGTRPFVALVENCTPTLVLTGGPLAEQMRPFCAGFPELKSIACLNTAECAEAASDGFFAPRLTRETLALLQYTSGSTSSPRAVCISHGNILENAFVIQHSFRHWTTLGNDAGVCWAPLFHDMGLYSVLQAVYVDAPCYLMSPQDFVRRPLNWLRAITKYRAHTSVGPNFAYDMCVQRITEAQKSTLDLSHWEVAGIGAESVSAATIERFTAKFQDCGFRREAFYPSYGLAEATLFVSGSNRIGAPLVREVLQAEHGGHGPITNQEGAKSNDAIDNEDGPADSGATKPPMQRVVGCGCAWPRHDIVIADPWSSAECPAGAVGEIWLSGPSVARGYWNSPAETQATFGAYLSGSVRGPYLRTGDLGFLVDGELFVTGRLKEIIIIEGRNYYPQDIEDAVRSVHAAFRPNRGAAFGCARDGQERLVVVQEIDRQSRRLDICSLRREIRKAVTERVQLPIYDIVFVRNDSLPRTTSGKIRRNACRQLYLDGRLALWREKGLA